MPPEAASGEAGREVHSDDARERAVPQPMRSACAAAAVGGAVVKEEELLWEGCAGAQLEVNYVSQIVMSFMAARDCMVRSSQSWRWCRVQGYTYGSPTAYKLCTTKPMSGRGERTRPLRAVRAFVTLHAGNRTPAALSGRGRVAPS
ncbi:hypothetical protein FGB62_102g017 [Gracilaria domingensis]|nr:hypothetical protein FGB62_102g017 [Gracilaria domingensis]